MAVILVLLLALCYALYKFSTRNFDFWKKKGVPYLEPSPIFGNFFEVISTRATIGHFLAKCCEQFNTPYFGMYVFNTPHLVIKDPNLIKAILVKDFNYFADRTILSDAECDPLTAKMMFIAKNPEWKTIRTKMSPVFSSGKIKNMFKLINEAASEMKEYISNQRDHKSIDAKELSAKYSTNVIASCAFGINAYSFKYENAQFRAVGRKIFDFSLKNSFRQSSYFLAPGLVKFFKMPFLDTEVADFMREVFLKTIEEREKGGYKRNDLVDIIIQMKNNTTSDFKFTDDWLVSQAAQFFGAGFETVSATVSFTLYELCLHSEIQTKLRAEVKAAESEHGELSYEAIQSMKYLDMVICETLRKYPVLPFLDRRCMDDYKLPGSDLVIEKGTPIFIPMFGLHYDKQFFPEPEKYDPERFSDENKTKLPPFAYIPFGEGPRVCIGERFGLLVTKLGLASILSEFEVERSADTPVPIKFETKSLVLASTVGLPMKFKMIISEAA